MSRRAKSNSGPIWLALAFLLLLGAGGGYYTWNKARNDPFRTVPVLDVEAYLDNAESLRGNIYKIEASVQNSLAWSPGDGRLMALEINKGRDRRIVPVLIPSKHNGINLQRGQTFILKVEVVQDGLLRAIELRKS